LRPREPEMTADGAPAVVNAWHSRSAVRSGYAEGPVPVACGMQGKAGQT
jgi:hypothetical protein